MAEKNKPSIEDQIAEVMEVLEERRSAYPTHVKRERMTQADADRRIANLEAVLLTLRFCQRHKDAIAAATAPKKDGDKP